MGARVTEVDLNGVEVETSDGTERISAHTVVWAAGVQASPLAAQLAAATGADVDRSGHIAPLADLTLPGHPEVFVVGDMVTLNELPGVAEVAMQGSLHAANTIARRLHGETQSVPFRYRDLGSVATIGRFRAMCSFWRIRLQRSSRVARLDVRAPRVPQWVREPHLDDVPWVTSMIGRSREGTGVQRRPHRWRPERARRRRALRSARLRSLPFVRVPTRSPERPVIRSEGSESGHPRFA